MPWKRKAALGVGVGVGILSTGFVAQRQWDRLTRVTWNDIPPPNYEVPSREQQITKLKENSPYDILVIGGGATGTGVALDAASRKMKVALVEKDDFGAGLLFLNLLELFSGIIDR